MPEHPRQTIVCIGTGPSLTREQCDIAAAKGFTLYGCNNAYQMADLDVLYAINRNWWEHYWPEVRSLDCEKWTGDKTVADEFGIRYIEAVPGEGLSTDPAYIHHGHGSGYSLVGLAHRAGARRIVLLGYDLQYAPDYDGKARKIGSRPRHFFGEYPELMRHWPWHQVKNGKHIELIELYRTVAMQNAVEIINCSPGSAVDAFAQMDIVDVG